MDLKENWKLVYEWYETFEDKEEDWEKFEEQKERLDEIFGGHGWYITEQP